MPDKLATYHAKRNFQLTPEPSGDVADATYRLRFVVQKHAASHLHYDFRLELDGTLKSWAIPKGPSLDPSVKRLAVQVEDHPLGYIDFEGDIPERQYGAGHVDAWDIGTWQPEGDALAGYRDGKLKFQLDGEKLHGGWTLVRTHMSARGGKEQWLLLKERDENARPADEYDVVVEAPDSVLTTARQANPSRVKKASAKRAPSKQSLKSPLPASLKPQLATLVEEAPTSGNWVYELKFDGYRLLARLDHGEVKLFTREGNDWTAKLPKQAQALAALDVDDAWLDGEIVVLDEKGVPSFQLLQNAFDSSSTSTIVYFVFDLLYCNGEDCRALPLVERRARLQSLLENHSSDLLRFSTTLEESPQRLLSGACGIGMEGIIGKQADAPYVGKRSNTWIKLKCKQRQEFVVLGYTEPQGTRQYFGSLLLGVYDDGELRYAGRVGTGFDSDTLASLYKRMTPLAQAKSSLAAIPADARRRGTHWIKPELVAEVSFAEWTADGMVRQAVFQGLRMDKPAQDISREKPIGNDRIKSDDTNVAGIAITHGERVVDSTSGARKIDLVRYYEKVAPRLLPYLQNRPVYLLRGTEGIGGELFFQKHVSKTAMPGIRTLDPSLDPGHAPLMVIDDVQALAGVAQMDTIELHTCNATADRIDRPDCMVFDLDPDPALPWERIVEGATLTKVLLDELGLTSFVKTSGGKGLHIVVPLTRRHTWEEVAAFSQAVAAHMAQTLPALFSAKMGAKNRVQKIFIDYLRNKKPASTVAAYSVRARLGLGVSMPMAWDELESIESAAHWTIANIDERLAGADPWQDYFAMRQVLNAAMKSKIGCQ